jgi:hypothetical protein
VDDVLRGKTKNEEKIIIIIYIYIYIYNYHFFKQIFLSFFIKIIFGKLFVFKV